MNYPQSASILEKIKSVNNILINCHKNPDVDSISSALSMRQALLQLNKQVTIISPDEPHRELSFLTAWDKIEKIDYESFDFSKYDLFLVLDSASSEVVTGSKDISLPDISKVIIDHHKTNSGFGEINIIDPQRSATTEALYLIFQDWGLDVNKDIATSLLTGILGDTGAFEYHNTTPQTLQIAAELMIRGANKDEILLKIFRSKKLNLLKFWGQVLDKMEVDPSGKFSWCAIPYTIYADLDKPPTARQSASSMFIRMVEGTEFGIVMLEEEPGILEVSFRGRANFDVSQIATRLGGGGHSGAAATKITDMGFNDAVEKVLEETRKMI